MRRLIDADALLESVKVIGNRPLPDVRTLKDLEQAIVNTYHAVLNEITNAPTVDRELVIDCKTCSNRGVVNGSSQETFCEHCIHSTSWKRNYYKPLSAVNESE